MKEPPLSTLWRRSIQQAIEDGDFVLTDLGEWSVENGFLKGALGEVLITDAWLAGLADETPRGKARRQERRDELEAWFQKFKTKRRKPL